MPTSMTLAHAPEAVPARYLLGDVDASGRYPVTVDGQLTGHVSRWHGTWRAATLTGLTLPDRHDDRYTAAQHLADITDPATPAPTVPTDSAHVRLTAHAHLLDPGLSATPRNVISAAVALARLDELAWVPLAGYPGADNRWHLKCLVCREDRERREPRDLGPWTGVRFWSHLRGRNGDGIPRPLCRHDGCAPIPEHADLIKRLAPAPEPACLCPEAHPTAPGAAKPLLDATAAAWRRRDQDALLELLTRLLGPCPASRARATALQSLAAKPASASR